MKIRISHFGSSACLFVLAIFLLFSPPLVMQLLESDSTTVNVEDVTVLVYIWLYAAGVIVLCGSFSDAKYYDLTKQGISLNILGVTYRKIKWENIYDVMIGPDPLQKYTTQTLLLNCQPGHKYRPREPYLTSSMYEESFYKDFYRGRIIRLRCGKKLDAVLMLLNECFLGDIDDRRNKSL